MATVTFEQARRCVIETVPLAGGRRWTNAVPLDQAFGRVLAAAVTADRDFPALPRSVRDGFAVRSGDTPGRLRVIGEVRAGGIFQGEMGEGEAVEIMTGAPVPRAADAVVMVEHVERDGDFVSVPRAEPDQFVNPQGAEARSGQILADAGQRIRAAEIALLASAGCASVEVYERPAVAILSTGDEIVEVGEQPEPHQVRNSNAHALASEVRNAGGIPEILPVAKDSVEDTRALLERAFEAGIVLISGGVSAGKYDVVEPALERLGAEFFFDRVRIQPGQPLVFGRVRDRYFFGLPGNPVSTMVTFELFARAAIDRLQGIAEPALPLMPARLTTAFHHKPGLTRFLPAKLSADGAEVTPVPWHGSSDIPAVARGNAFLVADADRENWAAGDSIRVLLR